MNRAIRILMTTLAVVLILGAIWTFGPREPFDREPAFDASVLPADLDAYLEEAEARFDDITPGAEKEIIWAGAAGERTPLAIVYLHGFSATKQEIRPVPDQLASALGANLYYARFAGHGRPGARLAEPQAGDWLRDAAEALTIGKRLGDRVLVVATSTGATMATIALADPALAEGVAGLIAVSPNYKVKAAPRAVLNMPFGRYLLPLALGEERSYEPKSEAQGKWWTTSYPLTAVLTMGRAVEEARRVKFEALTTPALFIFSDADSVIDHAETRRVAARWGASVQIANPDIPSGENVSTHVIAGDIQNPSLTAEVAEISRAWAVTLR